MLWSCLWRPFPSGSVETRAPDDKSIQLLVERFFYTFPSARPHEITLTLPYSYVQDPDESNEATDARMNEQFAVLTRALKDDVPAVRAVAVTGTCHILNTYWELIPGAVITGYLKLIAADLAFDGAAPAVRAAVAAGLATMVDNPLAQPLLKLLLPKLEPMLYDASAKVRMAFADLLLSLRGLRALKWYDIVDVHKLLDVMTSDTPAVSERIQRLLLPSYFPDAETGPAMVAALLRASPEAGRAFCLYLAGAHMPGTGGVGAATPVSAGPAVAEHCLVALVKDLTAHLLTVPLATAAELAAAAKGGKKGRNKRKKARGDDEGEDPAQARDDAVVETQETWEAILGGLAAVCCGLGALIAAGKAEPGVVRSLFAGGELATLLGRCKAATARADIASVAAALPTTVGSSEIRAYFASQLVAAGPMSDATELKAGVDCLCASPAARNLLVRSIASAFGAVPTEVCPLSGEEEEAARKGNRGKKKQDIAELLALEGLTQASAIEHLGIMLEMEAPRSFLITSGTLGRMLPWVEAAAEGRVAELAAAVAAAAVPDELGGRAEAAGAAVVYMRGGLHLILAAQPGLTEEPLLAGTEGYVPVSFSQTTSPIAECTVDNKALLILFDSYRSSAETLLKGKVWSACSRLRNGPPGCCTLSSMKQTQTRWSQH